IITALFSSAVIIQPSMKQFKSVELVIKQYKRSRGLTLIELLIALSLFTLIVLGFSNIDTFSRYHVMSSDRRAKLQNDASYVLEHMAKEINKAIGDVNNSAVVIEDSNRRVKIYIDLASDGSSAGDGKRGTEGDRWIAYQFTVSPNYEIRYYSDYIGNPTSYEIISRKASSFSSTYSPANNYVEVQLTACWNPASPGTCGTSPDNPNVKMLNRINMPAVSTH
ncbi:MAG: prepilin-type N-terminal cleavage/methylation domain-containing protein, partial [Candidatus Omnitrophota bacterium]|nr:prepilin-type N-terminal cleavage/methylation domain-containing protein [Candidatus Omnitrophota bacterium]